MTDKNKSLKNDSSLGKVEIEVTPEWRAAVERVLLSHFAFSDVQWDPDEVVQEIFQAMGHG